MEVINMPFTASGVVPLQTTPSASDCFPFASRQKPSHSKILIFPGGGRESTLHKSGKFLRKESLALFFPVIIFKFN